MVSKLHILSQNWPCAGYIEPMLDHLHRCWADVTLDWPHVTPCKINSYCNCFRIMRQKKRFDTFGAGFAGHQMSPDVTSAEQEPMPPMTPPRDTRRVQALVALLSWCFDGHRRHQSGDEGTRCSGCSNWGRSQSIFCDSNAKAWLGSLGHPRSTWCTFALVMCQTGSECVRRMKNIMTYQEHEESIDVLHDIAHSLAC